VVAVGTILEAAPLELAVLGQAQRGRSILRFQEAQEPQAKDMLAEITP
jgi:hypothetical protein